MRFIAKRNSGSYLLGQAHQNPPTTATQATSRWSSFGHKANLLTYLLDEQFGLCCYSELRADLENLGYHIEHIRPKSQYPVQTFDYGNLAASALSNNDIQAFKTINEETFGGHAKLSAYNPILFISCHYANCDRYFAYLSDGRVVASDSLSDFDKQRADYTIGLLNLNSPYLINRRRRWYDELEQFFEEHINKNWRIEDLAAIDLLPTNQRLSQFFSITRQFFGIV
jgi:uncharacterized protein (TIGR02646 family)